MMTFLLGAVASALDLGYLFLVRTQLQVAADSAAMAGTAIMIESDGDATATAQSFAGQHLAGSQAVELRRADVEFGTWDFEARQFTPSTPRQNAIRVTARRDETSGGEVSLFFAQVFGIQSQGVRAEATAAFVDDFRGFRRPSTGENLPFLPFALDQGTSDAMLAGSGSDDWTWDPQSKQIRPGPDGIPEANLYPQDTGAPANRGTVNIGNGANSTAELARQILQGLSPEDLSYHGGSLELDEHGILDLAGDPGISAGMGDELAAIRGEPRTIMVFNEVSGGGSNTQYQIVEFVGIRIMEVSLTGGPNDKRVIIQPAPVTVLGGIPSSGDTPRSEFVFSPICLVE